MTEADKKNIGHNQIQFLVCPTCAGLGKIQTKPCQDCQGVGMYAWTGQSLLYWSKKINFVQVNQDRLVELIKNSVSLLLFLFGAAGLFLFGWVILSRLEGHLPVWGFYKLMNWQMLIFWTSLVTDGYLVYRFARDYEKIKFIPKREYEYHLPILKPITWEEAKKLPPEKLVDVVDYFTFSARQAISKAWEISINHKNQDTNPVHLLIALLSYKQIQIIFSRL